MTEFADLSEVLNRLSGGNSGNPETLYYNKENRTRTQGTSFTKVTGKLYGLWQIDGVPANGAVPTTAAVPTSATKGAMPFTNASGGREKRLICATFGDCSGAPNVSPSLSGLFLHDRLLHCGNLSGTTTGAQNVQSGSGVSLTRHTGGVGNEIWLEVYTSALGTTDTTATCSYTNQAGTAGRTTQPLQVGGSGSQKGANAVGEVARFSLQAGDTGVRSVETCTLAASTGSAGVWGITIVNRIGTVNILDGAGICDFLMTEAGTYVIEDNACISMFARATGTASTNVTGVLATAER